MAHQAPLQLAEATAIRNVFCYIIKHYGNDGLSMTVNRRKSGTDVEVKLVVADWAGKPIDLRAGSDKAKLALQYVNASGKQIIGGMAAIGLGSAQFFSVYDGSEFTLVDVRKNESAFVGPGMLKDLFGPTLRVQETIKVAIVDDQLLGLLQAGHGEFAGNLILKPSRFRTVGQRDLRPFYVEITRQ